MNTREDRQGHEGCGGGFRSDPEPFAAADAAPRRTPDRTAATLFVSLDLVVDPAEKSLAGVATHRFRILADSAPTLAFDAVGLRIESVRADGKDASFTHDGERLVVRLPRPLDRGAETEIAVRYGGSPVRGLWFVAPDADRPDKPLQAWTQGQDEDSRYWFPCVDHPQEKAPSELRVSVPSGFTAISNGALVAREDRDGRTSFHWRQAAPHPTYLVTLVVGKFDASEDRVGGVPLGYWSPLGRGGDAARTFGRTPRMIELFGRLFGTPFPFEKYDQIVVSDFIFGGMENTSATTLHEYVMIDATVEDATDSDALISHELGHQWFGDLVTCRDWPHAWLNEGFATYCEVLWYEFGFDAERGRRHLLEKARAYYDEVAEAYSRPLVCATYDAPTDLFDRHLYEKGACVLHHLRTMVGDEAFFRGVARYVAAHRGGSVETIDLRRAFEAETGRSLEGFFEQWTATAGHAEFNVRHSWDERTKRLALSVKQPTRKEPGLHPFAATVLCRAWTKHGTHEKRFDVSRADHVFHWDLPEDPEGVRFAADCAPLFKIDFERPEGFLKTQLERDPELFGRVEAALQLAAAATPSGVAALAEAAAKETRWTHRVELLSALSRARTPAAREALSAAMRDSDPRVRMEAAEGLGKFVEPEAARHLKALLAVERHPLVKARAARALGRTRDPSAGPILRELARETGTWNDAVPRLALEGVAALRDSGESAVASEAMAKSRPDLVRGAAARALAALSAPAVRKTEARELLEPLLLDGFLVARSAIAALRTLGDVEAVPALSRLAARRYVDGRLKRLARFAAAGLREIRPDRDQIRRLADRADRAESELRGLIERVAKLESPPGKKTGKRPKPAAVAKAAKKNPAPAKRKPPNAGRSAAKPRRKRS